MGTMHEKLVTYPGARVSQERTTSLHLKEIGRLAYLLSNCKLATRVALLLLAFSSTPRGYADDEARLRQLIQDLRSSNVQVSHKAEKELGSFKSPEAIRLLLKALEEEVAGGRAKSVLSTIGEPAVKPLIAFLKTSPQIRTKFRAEDALSGIIDPKALEPLIEGLNNDDEAICSSVASALGKIKDGRAVEPLMSALENEKCRHNAISALGKLGDVRTIRPLIAALADRNVNNSQAATTALSTLGEPAVKPLIDFLKSNKRRGIPNYDGARMALSGISDPKALEPLIEALKDDDEVICISAADALGRVKDGRAVEPLLSALKNEKCRASAILALGELGDLRATRPLIGALADHSHDVRYSAAKSLGRLGDASAVEPLVRALGDGVSLVRHAAHDAIVSIGEPAAAVLITALRNADDTNQVIAFHVAHALTDLPPPAELPLSLLDHGNKHVRLAVAWALINVYKSYTTRKDQAWERVHTLFKRETLAKVAQTYESMLAKRKLARDDVYILVFTLEEHGNKDMALRFLSRGGPLLQDVAYYWAKSHGYTVIGYSR